MTVKEILSQNKIPTLDGDIDFAELRRQTLILASAANKRVKRIEKTGVVSEAVQKSKKEGGRFSVAGKTNEQLFAEFIRVQSFLKAGSGTLGGARKIQMRIEQKHGRAVVAAMKDPRFWDVYQKAKEAGLIGKITPSEFARQFQRYIEENPQTSAGELLSRMQKLKTESEEMEREALEGGDIIGASDFFEL